MATEASPATTQSRITNFVQYYWKKIQEFSEQRRPYLVIVGIALGYFTARYTSIKLYRKNRKYIITGPIGLPIIGTALAFLRSPYATLNNIGSYGKVTTVQLGFNTNIFVNDIGLSKKVMGHKAIGLYRPPFANPPHFLHFLALSGNTSAKRRKIFANNLIAKISNSEYIHNNIRQTMDSDIIPDLEKIIKNNELWFPAKHCSFIDCNLMFNGIFGLNISLNNDKTGYVSKLLPVPEQWFVSITRVLILAACVKVNVGSFLFNKFTRNHNQLEKAAGSILVEFMEKYGDFVFDVKHNSLSRKTNKASYSDFMINETELNMTEIMSDIALALIAGTNTPSKAMEYGLVLLSRNPEIQEQIYEELCGIQNHVRDINKASILKAFVYESLRVSVVSPMGIPHYASEDVVIENTYFIPKGSIVHNNMYFMHKKGSNSGTIHLENWLDKNDKFKMNSKVFGLFGAGPRSCPSRAVAMKLLYYVFAMLIMRYKLISTGNEEMKQVFATVSVLKTPIGIKLQKRI